MKQWLFNQIRSVLKSYHLPLLLLLIALFSVSSCSSPKDTFASKKLQNLTSRYNIIYNSKVLLDESVRTIEEATQEDYGQLLSVYEEPTEATAQAVSGNLDSVLDKAKFIIDEKLYSNYVDDAYFLVGQANYYKARFYSAAEFFTYVYNSYPDSKSLRQKALIAQARSVLQLDNYKEAGVSLDSAFKHLNDSKKTRRSAADLYATTAQYLIKMGRETEAIDTLSKAIKAKGNKKNKIRWRYVLAQLQERNKQYEEAYKNYTAVVKSNAPFDMAFNAGLNRISIDDLREGQKSDRIARLKSLLKDEKNKNFIDQIYYRIGDTHWQKHETEKAIASYNTAVRKSANNQTQKGLSYLRIADIYFQNGDYVGAKAYYDSTLMTLPPSYKGYDIIRRKGNNLELLANRFRIIGREDTLQTLARLPQADRDVRIGELVREQMEKAQLLSISNSAPESIIAGIDRPNNDPVAQEGKFYFNNTTAISQGLSEFKRRWGNRALEDNWRRSGKTSAEALLSTADNPDAGPAIQPNQPPSRITPESIRAEYANRLPLTDSAMQASNQRIADSYYDIASFYRDELKDNAEAIKTFEELLKRAPESSYKLSVYYNLYRLYSGVDQQKSDEYKNLLLTKYPESPFAKVISDPDFAKKNNEKEAELNSAYNSVYDLYVEKKYNDVIKGIQEIESKHGNNQLSPQLSYLNSLAVGHTHKLPPFESSLKQIVSSYPDDKLITPLVQQHLLYISNNKALFDSRPTALTEYNPLEPVLEPDPLVAAIPQNTQATVVQTPGQIPAQPSANPPKTNSEPADKQTGVAEPIAPPVNNTTVPTPAKKEEPELKTTPAIPTPKPLYDLPEVGEYYFVVNVQDANANLNSSRFGVGQFNRARFSGSSIKHQLKEVNNENQLVFVGPFENYDAAKYYERSILPIIKDIMKVPAEKYNTFVIVKPELDKLANSTQINAYLEFYKNSR